MHVDIVSTDWLAGEQRAVARVFISGGNLKIDSPDRSRWEPLVEAALDELGEESAETKLARLKDAFQGSHLFATDPHAEDGCAYDQWAPVKIQSVSSDREPASL
jgi:hypothetical protein